MRKNNNIKSHRRNSTPWDNCKDLSCTQKFIKQNYNKEYNEAHKNLKASGEAEILNGFKVLKCHWCLSTNIVKNGKYKTGIIRYHCKDCGKNFNIITNTLLDHHKLNAYEQVKNMLDLFCGISFHSISKIQRNSPTTTKYWFKKVALALSFYIDSITLKGKVYIDTMFVNVEKKKISFSTKGKKLRGLSKNQICIVVATDTKHILAFEIGVGKPTGEKIAAVLYEKIEMNSKLFCDEDNSFLQLAQEQKLKVFSYNSEYLKTLTDDNNPIQPVNDAILLISEFLNKHKDFNREELQDYLNIICYNNIKGINKLNGAEILLEYILNNSFETVKTLKYREYYKKRVNNIKN